jgi:RHS repeat-associated protein
MPTLTNMQTLRLILSLAFLLCGTAQAQSLYDVVVSLTDRQRVVNQRTQVSVHLRNLNTNPDTPAPGDVPIDWLEVGTNPTKTAVEELGIGEKIALLNQAVQEFERLKYEFLNSSDGEFTAESTVGSVRHYGGSDFDPLPRATPGNYHELLRALALRVSSLRLTTWVAAFTQKQQTRKTSVYESVAYNDPGDEDENNDREPYVKLVPEGTNPSSFTWKPATIRPDGFLNVQNSQDIHTLHEIHAEVRAMGGYNETVSEEVEQNLRSTNHGLTVLYPESVQYTATAPGANGNQIDGAVFILRRSMWNELSVEGTHPYFQKTQASYVVVGTGNTGSLTLFSSPPAATFPGTWKSWDEGSTSQTFVPTGYQHYYDAIGYPDVFAYEFRWSVGCTFKTVFKPSFTRGVDAPGIRAKLESAASFFADTTADGKLLLNPRPGLLFGIELGPGLKGLGNGYVSCGSPRGPRSGTKEMHRFDATYSLQFAGSSADYHVVYDNNRSTRTQSLPSLCWLRPDFYSGNDNWTLYDAWDSPRLKQIVGRDLVASLEYDGKHYGGYTVKIYRRPTESPAPVPGQALDVTGMTLIRTWDFSHTEVDTPHPTDAEKLEVVGDDEENYVIKANHILTDLEWEHSQNGWWWGWTGFEEFFSGEQGIPYWRSYPGSWSWTLQALEGTSEKYRKDIQITTLYVDFGWAFTEFNSSEYLDEQLVSSLTSLSQEPFSDHTATEWVITSANKTISGSAVLVDLNDPAYAAHGYGKWPSAGSIQYDGIQPDVSFAWDANGLMTSQIQGLWSSSGTADDDTYTITQMFDESIIGTDWIEFVDGGNKVKTYTSPDGNTVTKTDTSVAWSEVQYGTPTVGLLGLPHKLTHNLTQTDGSQTKWTWNIANDHTGTLTLESGIFTADALTNGQRQTTAWNKRGHTTSSTSQTLLAGETITTADLLVPETKFTTWGAPKQTKDLLTNLSTLITYSGNLNRPSSITSPLGLTTQFNNYDIFNRPAQTISNGITATTTYTGLGATTTYTGTDITPGSQTSFNQNALGTEYSNTTTWGGITQTSHITHGSSATTTGSHSLLGSSETTLRNTDGTLATTEGDTQPFGGVEGHPLTIEDGLLVTKTEVADQPGTYTETHSDAWGRPHKISTPSKSSGSTETTFEYSDPDEPIKRVITNEPTGRVLITESEANGTITRSGIDVNKNGSFGASDRYTESTTTVSEGNIVTTLKVTEDSGLREVMESTFNPSSGVTVTKINGNEETITTTPNYNNKTVKTESNKGWERTTAHNNLGLPTTNTLTGTGIPTTNLTPTWRADGSLQGISLTIGGETHTAAFKQDSTLASLTAPGRGNILGGHDISNGVEILTIDGVTVETKLDGTETDISGGDVIGKNDKLTLHGGGFKNTITPEAGASTDTTLSAAGAPLAKTYADNTSENYGYSSELLTSASLARGGSLTLNYSNDGAKDLTAATWPAMTSGPFTIPSVGVGYGYNRSGNINALSDPSGTRAINYHNGRQTGTAYTAGFLKGYEIISGRDTVGRHTGTLIKRYGAPIHTTAQAPNGASDQITNLASGNITATPQRNAAGNITGYIWSDGTNSVSQSWVRGAGGRINSAESNVPGAPLFVYAVDENAFDGFGRRLKCTTAGGTWTYSYSAGGQLASATHPSLGSFNYSFDGIGRRTDKGEANTSDILNRTTAWTHNQNKTLTINAHPDARVWFNGVEIQNFIGTHQHALTPPGAEGGWVPWETLAILEGAGEGAGNPPANPNASPDAKAEKKGAVWIPPAAETLTYDAAGNRQSSAQWDYGWDAKNQLSRVRTKNHTTAPQAYDITFTYDAEGRRVKKHVIEYRNGAVVSEKIITFLWDGWNLLYERHQLPSGLTTLERKYLWGPDIANGQAGGAGGLLLIRETKGTTTTEIIPLYDGTGHIVALTDIHKTLLATYAYGPFGEKISAEGPQAQSNPWRYATKYLDEETGLYYFGHRYLDPITGQWMSRDPLGESQGPNLFIYCHNDPVNHVDVLGLAEVAIDKNGNLTAVGRSLLRMMQGGAVDAAVSLLYELQVGAELGSLEEEFYRNPTPRTGQPYSEADLLQRTLGATTAAGLATRGELRTLWSKGGAGHFDRNNTLGLVPRSLDIYSANANYLSFLPITQAGAAEGQKQIAASRYSQSRIWAPSAVASRAGYGVAESLGGLDAYAALSGNRVYFDDLSFWRTYETSAGDRAFSAAMILPWGRVVSPVKRIVSSGGRYLKMPSLNYGLNGTTTLGETMANGDVFLKPGLSRAEQVSTLRHESVHAFLSVPDGAPLATLRQNIGMWGYNRSHLLRFTEEAIAEGYATRSIRQGILHPLENGYGISIPRLGVEAGLIGGGIGGAWYLGNQWGGEE